MKSHNEVTPFIDSARKSMKGNTEGGIESLQGTARCLIDEVSAGRVRSAKEFKWNMCEPLKICLNNRVSKFH